MDFPKIRLFVGNLPEDTKQKDLEALFSSYGEIYNLDIKSKAEEENKKSFAFVTLSASHNQVESCIKHFSHATFNGNKLYVTRARESFLERLERERAQQNTQQTVYSEHNNAIDTVPVLKLGPKLNPGKRNLGTKQHEAGDRSVKKNHKSISHSETNVQEQPVSNKKKDSSDKKRIESLQKKRQEYREKKNLIKAGLGAIDNVQNKKIVFSDDDTATSNTTPKRKNLDATLSIQNNSSKKLRQDLFDDDDSGDEVNFNIKKQYEGKQGQKVLDLQSRYKSDKRFTLDERFIEDEQIEGDQNEARYEEEKGQIEQFDEKTRQLNILQDVLGVAVRTNNNKETGNKSKAKAKLGMLRFDPLQPDHAKFLAPAEQPQEHSKKSKNKKSKQKQEDKQAPEPEIEKIEPPKVEVSKEQFYKVSETLKEAITKPTTFSLRSLFGSNENDNGKEEKEEDYIPLKMPIHDKKKVRNPMDPGEKNPFVYDSSESEDEQDKGQTNTNEVQEAAVTNQAVWKENLFFSQTDHRFKDGLAFFNNTHEREAPKERRELKSVMKKRIYNKERKNQMFQRKIGGRRKTMKKSYRKKS